MTCPETKQVIEPADCNKCKRGKRCTTWWSEVMKAERGAVASVRASKGGGE